MPYSRLTRNKPFRRPRTYRRRVRTTRRTGTKVYRPISYNPSVKYNSTIYLKRKTDRFWDPRAGADYADITTTGGTANIFNMAFRLEELPNDTEFFEMYRYYKILGVKIKFITSQNVSTSEVRPLPTLFTYWNPEFEDAPPANLQDFRERSNCKVTPFTPGRMITRYIKPRVAYALTDQDGNTSFANTYKGWLPTGNRTIQHAGLAVGVDCLLAADPSDRYVIKTEFTYYLAFKGVR